MIMERGVVEREFFDRPAVEVAPELLGCVLERETGEGVVAVELTEVEAYMGAADPASHAYRGQTPRNAVMFGPAGHAYVYFTYGMHFCVNLVCQLPGTASAVLLRAGKVIAGEELARARRLERRNGDGAISSRDLARGPARLCQALGIDRALDGADVCAADSSLRIKQRGTSNQCRYDSGPRVGISSGTDFAWRYWVPGEPTVSAYRAHVPKKRKAVTPSGR
jgi:DNA-3-methyladenine glycosylase